VLPFLLAIIVLFLSCLFGSEAVGVGPGGVQHFLSCLFGSEVP